MSKNSSLQIKSSVKLNSLFNNEIGLVISIPLITGKNEIIKFLFEKKNRDPIKQFQDLKIKYKKLKEKIYSRNSYSYYIEEDEKKFLDDLIDIIEDKKEKEDKSLKNK